MISQNYNFVLFCALLKLLPSPYSIHFFERVLTLTRLVTSTLSTYMITSTRDQARRPSDKQGKQDRDDSALSCKCRSEGPHQSEKPHMKIHNSRAFPHIEFVNIINAVVSKKIQSSWLIRNKRQLMKARGVSNHCNFYAC